jgi:hydrogenase maturation protein HypF
MIRNGVNSPPASSCGRLFDAMAALIGVCTKRQGHEGEAAARLEALACEQTLLHEADAFAYPFERIGSPVMHLDPSAMWRSALADLCCGTPEPVIAARFHKGLAIGLVAMTRALAEHARFDTVALSGGCLQNAVLFEQTERRLREVGFAVLSHSKVPANDGGLSLGQAAVAAARLMHEERADVPGHSRPHRADR